MVRRRRRDDDRGRRRRSRRNRDRYDEYEEYEEIIEYDDYDDDYDDYYEEEYVVDTDTVGGKIIQILVILLLIAIFIGVLASFYNSCNERRRARVYAPQEGYESQQPQENFEPVKIGKPKIDLKAVEEALWSTKTKNPKDFKAWMQKFEDEVNAIYFATLKRENPNADPTTLLPSPVRVEPKKINGLLHLYGYIDKNKKPGYQNKEDELIFVFKQTKPYQKGQRQLAYTLYDSSGYYYREPGYVHHITVDYTPFFMGFFLYATWEAFWWRTHFAWYASPYWWRSGFFYHRYHYYYRRYPTYRTYYRRTYYRRSRPWGWRRGVYYRRSRSGRYYRRGSYGRRSRFGRSRSRFGRRSRFGSRRSSFGRRSRFGSRRSSFGRRSRFGSRRSSFGRRSGGKW